MSHFDPYKPRLVAILKVLELFHTQLEEAFDEYDRVLKEERDKLSPVHELPARDTQRLDELEGMTVDLDALIAKLKRVLK